MARGYVLPPANVMDNNSGENAGDMEHGHSIMGGNDDGMGQQTASLGGDGGGEESVRGPRGRKRRPEPGSVAGEATEALGKRARKVNREIDEWVVAAQTYLKDTQPLDSGSSEWRELVDLW